MGKIIRVNFKSKLHLICGTNEARPGVCHVWFKNGFAYATDGHIAIKQSLKLHDLSEEGIENLEGKAIHADTFKELLRYDLIQPEKDHIKAANKNITAEFQYATFGGKFPDIEGAISIGLPKKIERIGINFNLMKRLNQALINDIGNSYQLEFYGNDKSIIIKTNQKYYEEEQLAILMPVMLSE